MREDLIRVVSDEEKIKGILGHDHPGAACRLVVLDDSKKGVFERRKAIHDLLSIQKRIGKIASLVDEKLDSEQLKEVSKSLVDSSRKLQPFVDLFDRIGSQ